MNKIFYLLWFVLLFNACSENSTSLNKDTEKPNVSISYPPNNSEFHKGTTISITANASDNEGIKDVIFYIDGEIVYIDDSEPFNFDWNTTSEIGDHAIQVSANDISNNVGESNIVNVIINEVELETGTVSDIDGNIYQTVKIGDQWWMAENLKVTHYRNGESIPNVTDTDTWYHLTTSAYCNYFDNDSVVAIYGSLYNWFAVNDSNNIAPIGWHIPSLTEWQTLVDYLGGVYTAIIKMKTTTGWYENGNGDNSSGFSALPSGYRTSTGYFAGLDLASIYWSTSEYDSTHAYAMRLVYDYLRIFIDAFYKQAGHSIRCVKD